MFWEKFIPITRWKYSKDEFDDGVLGDEVAEVARKTEDPETPLRASSDRRAQLNSDLSSPGLWITGLATQYPPHLISAGQFEQYVKRFYDAESPGLKQLLSINQSTRIETRSSIRSWEDLLHDPDPLDISAQDAYFRSAGVDLTVQACQKALAEWGGSPAAITHAVGVTCTNNGNPGYDLLVAAKLGLRDDVDRTLLHGVGCAGGLAALRTAAQLAHGASSRHRPARILVFACELSSLNSRFELGRMAEDGQVNVAPALFSDAAAALVLCNESGMRDGEVGVLKLVDWANTCLAETQPQISYLIEPMGHRTTLSKAIPSYLAKSIPGLSDRLLPSFEVATSKSGLAARNFEWAVHPGGWAVLKGVEQCMQLSEEQLLASYEIYKTRGNSSSPTILTVLDRLRHAQNGENIVATSFGPGLAIEMAMLERC